MSRARDAYIGPYRIEVKIGDGGMGVVYKCYDPKLKRFVALKILKEKYATDKKYIDRFRREAQAIASLSHPNVAQIYSIEDGNGTGPYLVMEYIDGVSAEVLLDRGGTLSFQQAASIVRDAALGLRAAFQKGIIHRDVKPSNILISSDGTVKLVDFGLAKEIEGTPSLTDEGMVLGTPHYISPEQGRGKRVDQRSDIYSLGATLYHLITGKPPFDGDSQMAVIVAHLSKVPKPPHQIRSDVPESMSLVVGRMMAKDPEKRYGDYQDLVDDLDHLIRGEKIGTRTAANGARTYRREPRVPAAFWWAMVTAVLLAVFATLAVVSRVLPFQEAEASRLEKLQNWYVHQGEGESFTECFNLTFDHFPRGLTRSELIRTLFLLHPQDEERSQLLMNDTFQLKKLSGPVLLRYPLARLDEVILQGLQFEGQVDFGLILSHPDGAHIRSLKFSLRSQPGQLLISAERNNDPVLLQTASAASNLVGGQYDVDLRLHPDKGENFTRVQITLVRRVQDGTESLFTTEEGGIRLPGTDWRRGLLLFWGPSPSVPGSVKIENAIRIVGLTENQERLESYPPDTVFLGEKPWQS